MASFTMTISEIMRDHGVDDVTTAVAHGHIIGLDTYPIHSEPYRAVLNEKIIRRYWLREIGHPHLEQFRFRMDTVMREVMPYYNELYLSTQLQYDPLKTIDLETIGSVKTKTQSEATDMSTNTADTGSRTVNSAMPQVHLSGNGDYADSASDANSESLNTSNSNQNAEGSQDTENASKTSGYQAVPADLVVKYRDTIINVDLMILDHLSRLFMAILSTGHEYFYSQPPYLLNRWPGLYY